MRQIWQTATPSPTDKANKVNNNYKLDKQSKQDKQQPEARQKGQNILLYNNYKLVETQKYIIFISYKSRYFRRRFIY